MTCIGLAPVCFLGFTNTCTTVKDLRMTIYVDQAGLDFIEMLLPLPQVPALKACTWSLLPVKWQRSGRSAILAMKIMLIIPGLRQSPEWLKEVKGSLTKISLLCLEERWLEMLGKDLISQRV